MPLMKSKSKPAFEHNLKAELGAGKPKDQALAIAYSTQKQARKKKMALGGAVETDTHSKGYSRNPGTPEKKPDDSRPPEGDYMGQKWSGGRAPARKPDDMCPPKEQYMGQKWAEGGQVNTDLQQSKMQAPKGSSPAQMASYHEMEAERYKMMADGGMVAEEYGSGPENDMEPAVRGRKADDERLPESEYMSGRFYDGGPVDSMEDQERPSTIAEAILRKRKFAEGGQVDLEHNSEEHENMEDDLSYAALKKEQYDDRQISPQPEDSNEKGDSREDDSENKHDMISQIRSKMKAKRGG